MEGKSVQIPDVLNDPEYAFREFARLGGYRTILGVPLLREGVPIGLLVLHRAAVRPFTEKQIKLVETFADQAVIAIENVRLFEAEQQRTRELTQSLQQQTATAEVLKTISRSAFDLQPVLDTLVQSAARLCEADFAFIFQRFGDLFHLVASHGFSGEFIEWQKRNPIPLGRETLTGRTALERKIIHIPDVLLDAEYTWKRSIELAGFRTMLGIPLLREGIPIGVIALHRVGTVRPFTDRQIELLTTFADQAVIAIENARLLNELRQRTDDLSQRTADLTETLEQQTATAEVLGIISSSSGNLKPIFEAMLASAMRICDAELGNIWLYDGERYNVQAMRGAPPTLVENWSKGPLRFGPDTGLGRLANMKQTVHIADIKAEKAYAERDRLRVVTADILGARTFLAVPMLKDDTLMGAIVIYRREVRPFIDNQIALLTSFAAQAVIAIENARLLGELRQRTDELGRSVGELRALGEVSQAVNSTLDLQTVLSTIVAKAVQLSDTEAGAIYVFDDLQREFRLRATFGMDQELIEALTHQRIGLDEPNVVQALAQGEPVQVADLREGAPSVATEVIQRAGFCALLVAPLLRGEEIVGMLVVRRRTPGAFPQKTVDLIKTFAAQSAVAIENARLFRDVEASLEDLRTAQDRLIQTEKLASLGQLTAGIAHEIKNPLNFVNNFSAVSVELIDELREALGGAHLDSKLSTEIGEIADTLQGNLDKVVQHGKRADAIVKNMLLHSRQGSGEHRPVDINALVDESLNLAYHGARAEKQGFTITLERSFDPAAGEVDLFPQEIMRALLNLISNGFYAATKRKGRGGWRRLRAHACRHDQESRRQGRNHDPRQRHRYPAGGEGEAVQPFFTTKPAGEGTGLGLSISHDIIVKQHGGSIEVDTQPGEFTEFRIVLPRAGASLIKSGERM